VNYRRSIPYVLPKVTQQRQVFMKQRATLLLPVLMLATLTPLSVLGGLNIPTNSLFALIMTNGKAKPIQA
jgi:hypothetical protein